ncbi:50S ribosomal protein L6 [Candidatus Falkowbacteria bacterium]|nr:50S ribosomal protein L6 [Candidatus Falkowbacteria bacterium]
MSRIGKQQINIPTGVDANLDHDILIIKGPKGQLAQKFHPQTKVQIKDNIITVSVDNENEKSQRALWGLFASLIKNMIIGVTQGFSQRLEINGIGFKAAISGKKLILNVGFSQPVEYNIPEGIEIKVEANNISLSGIDKQLVGEAAAQIRKIKKPEPYKGKGIKYTDEIIRRKAGKAAGSKS